MTKRIICIMAAIVALIACLALPCSAALALEKDYFEWTYNVTYTEGQNNEYGIKEIVAPLGYFTIYKSTPTDTAEKIYSFGFDTTLDGSHHINEYLALNVWERTTASAADMNYEDGYQVIRYRRLFLDSYSESLKPYEPKNDMHYTSVNIYHYFKALDHYDETPAALTETTITDSETDIDRSVYAYTFDALGEYEIKQKIVFFDSDTLTYSVIENSFTAYVKGTTDGENDAFQQGYDEGYAVGRIHGHSAGYRQALEELEGQEDWSIKGFIGAIMKAPFIFIENALDFTIFGINVAHGVRVLFTLGLIAVAVIWIVRCKG